MDAAAGSGAPVALFPELDAERAHLAFARRARERMVARLERVDPHSAADDITAEYVEMTVQEALVDLARELGDVQDVTGLRADLGISPTTRTFDVWFDNLFSDLSVRASIQDSALQVERASAAVHEAIRRMTLRGAALDQQLTELRARRDALLTG